MRGDREVEWVLGLLLRLNGGSLGKLTRLQLRVPVRRTAKGLFQRDGDAAKWVERYSTVRCLTASPFGVRH